MIAVVSTVSFVQPVFAGKPGHAGVNKEALASFSKDFILTSNVRWYKIKDVFVVDFYQQNSRYMAYYTEDGILNSISNTIGKDMLPATLTTRLNKKYDKAKIINVLKVRPLTNDNYYVIQLTTESNEQIIKVYEDGSIEKISSHKK